MILKENTYPESIDEHSDKSYKKPYVGLKKYWSTLLLFGVLSAIRSMTNILSCGLTSAYNVAIVNLLSPLITPVVDKFWLGAEIPLITWIAVAWTSVGCVAMVYGEYLIFGEDESQQAKGLQSAIGVAVQIVSVLTSVCIRMMMKTTTGVCTKVELMHSSNGATVLLGFTAGLLMVGWESVATLFQALVNPFSASFFWLMFLGFGVYTVGSYLQIQCCRLVGPGLYASYSSVRVAVAVVSSSVVLGEDIEGVWVWSGLILVGITVTWYTRAMMKWAKERKDVILSDRLEKGSQSSATTHENYSISDLDNVSVDNLVYERVNVILRDNREWTVPGVPNYGRMGQHTVKNVIF
ncbi:hypothetical protein TrCOL_g9696 [Triparma columacea]|uniref:WAT1-related protein n=1 Tax=Triparma columacea TaxID=722753 RepID=A0A9W7LBC2_9STRA|nr:hypothetical protein TrCOL_g9696 [Triparma columacea]